VVSGEWADVLTVGRADGAKGSRTPRIKVLRSLPSACPFGAASIQKMAPPSTDSIRSDCPSHRPVVESNTPTDRAR
jgi:hypothetical protein